MRHTSEQIAQRYKLTETTAEKLASALSESARAVTGVGIKARVFLGRPSAAVLDQVLSSPSGKAALANALDDRQVQEYLVFTKARLDRDTDSAAGQMATWTDLHLSLTSDQRKKVEPLLVNRTAKERLSTQTLLDMSPTEFVNLLSRLDVDARALDTVLSESQAKVWQLMTPKRNEKGLGGGRNLAEDEALKARFEVAEREIKAAVEVGRMTRAQAAERLEGMKRRCRLDPTQSPRSDRDENGDRARLLAAAQFAAHTEQLGELDARASKRLALVSKGVVEQFLEAQDRNEESKRDESEMLLDRVTKAVKAGRMTREEAGAALERLGRGGDEDEDRSRQQASSGDITNHPLYQQTIQNVLSDGAYAKCRARQAERITFREQASRDVVMAALDTLLILNDQQRNETKAIIRKLSIDANTPTSAALVQLAGILDRTGLNEWQRRTLDDVASKFGWGNRADGNVRRRR